MAEVVAPRVEGTVSVGDGRRLSFAEFGAPSGPTVVWMHGTPGARRQVPIDVRRRAAAEGIRVIGIDRPGAGSSTPHVYRDIAGFTDDLAQVADRLGVERFSVVGLSGGGPYALAAGARLADRVDVVGVLGGVAPTVGPDAIGGGLVAVGKVAAPFVQVVRLPLGRAISLGTRLIAPLGPQALDLYARLSPPGDRDLLRRPEFKSMFLDDLINGSRRQLSAPLSDVLLFSRHWGFELGEVTAPVVWWHGDQDNIVPIAHGRHVVGRLPGAEFHLLEGDGHLGGMGHGDGVLTAVAAHANGQSTGQTNYRAVP